MLKTSKPVARVEKLLRLLEQQGQISDEQRKEVVRRTPMLYRHVVTQHARLTNNHSEVSPVEIIAAAALRTLEGHALNEDKITEAFATLAGRRYLKVDPLKLNERLITQTMSRAFAQRHLCLPLERRADGVLIFGVDDPFNFSLQESLRNLAPQGFEIVVLSRSDIRKIITEVYGFRHAIQGAEAKIKLGVDIGNLEQLVRLSSIGELENNEKHIVSATEYLLHYAFDQRASDIHLEPKREICEIRLRIDGILHNLYRIPRSVHLAFVSRFKTLARMDIAVRRRPQAGRIKTERAGEETELRVSTLPVAFGEKMVIRVFDPQTLLQDLEELGMGQKDFQRYKRLIHRRTGLILVTGPTGSGKTTTLYSTLKYLVSPEINIMTAEDPIEMIFEPFNQSQVEPVSEMSFAQILRTILRQDPDIVMVGEIRDAETVTMAVQAALTGHLVFSTIHTNDAPSAITRLQELGVPNYLIASTLICAVGQRLVRKVCADCKETTSINEVEAAVLGIQLPPDAQESLPVAQGKGCPVCRGTGLFGRSAVFEVMEMDAGLRRLTSKGANAVELRREARSNGMTTMRESAIRLLALGKTSFDEVIRVMGES